MAAATRPYGSWPSPIAAELAASLDGRPEYVGTVGPEVWWTEPRPQEGGRRALVRRPAGDGPVGESVTALPAPWNVRSRVTEYGGLPWAGVERAEGGPLLVFVNFADQRLYAYEPDAPGDAATPRPLTPSPASAADCAGPTRCCAAPKSGACSRSSPDPGRPTSAGCPPPYRWTDRPPRTGPPCGN